jgi:hypothetical protein
MSNHLSYVLNLEKNEKIKNQGMEVSVRERKKKGNEILNEKKRRSN